MKNSQLSASLAALICASTLFAQSPATLKVGDLAPKFQVGKWYKGQPITSLKKGKVYVIDFWATRCGPCVEAIPHVAALAKRFQGKATVIGVSVQKWPDGSPNDTRALVADFLKTAKGKAMKYNVAADTDTGSMVKTWLSAAGFDFIPNAFVVSKDGRIAWMGDPTKLDAALAKIAR